MLLKRHRKLIITILPFIAIILLTATGYLYFKREKQENVAPVETKKDIYIEFLSEVYGKIKDNYWEDISDEQLSLLFKKGSEKLLENKEGLRTAIADLTKDMSPEQKKDFTVKLADIVLKNLKPFNRSKLYTTKQKKQLEERVRNINPETKKVEPTVSTKLVRSDIFYIKVKKISPTTFEEFKKVTTEVEDQENLNALILDLRGNVGGAVDVLQYFLGPFIGQNQYAYEFYHQGTYIPFKTKTGWLPSLIKYKKVVVLIDKQTQSSAEIMAATLKKYNVGVVIGTATKGWGTIEKVFSIDQQLDLNETYSMFLVHSVTLRDDNQPIEGRGVDPVININDENWEKQLFDYFHYDELIEAVKEVLKEN